MWVVSLGGPIWGEVIVDIQTTRNRSDYYVRGLVSKNRMDL